MPLVLQEPKEKKAHRDKQSREEAKAEKREKESKREEKHDRIKLKRSFTPEWEEREHHREWEEARGSSVTSNGSSHRSHTQPSPEESPRYADDRG